MGQLLLKRPNNFSKLETLGRGLGKAPDQLVQIQKSFHQRWIRPNVPLAALGIELTTGYRLTRRNELLWPKRNRSEAEVPCRF